MKLAAHLKQSSHGIFYFRLIIPAALRPLYNGQRKFKRSLKTRNPATAHQPAYILWSESRQRVREAKLAMSENDKKKDKTDVSTDLATDDSYATQWNSRVSRSGEGFFKADPSKPGDSEAASAAMADYT